ncbi:phage GP46 family protein [Novosphingobium sp. BL-8A]|uniref:phage GP46 family protein n=1 Tax=Novosphingobium sp. BL-8A TaxID=3127639 RepID=UPI003756D456
MTDIVTSWDAPSGSGDWLFTPEFPMLWTDENGDPIIDEGGGLIDAIIAPTLPSSHDLATAVLISLFSDALAGEDDQLPDQSGDRRGWWAGSIGSKLWLRQRSKQTPTVLQLVKDDIKSALAWMIEDGVAASIDVETEFTRSGMLGSRVVIHRRDGTNVALRFANLWDLI